MDISKAINMAVMAVSMDKMLDMKTKREIIETLAYAESKILEQEDTDDEAE